LELNCLSVRPMLRRLLYAFAVAPGYHLDRSAIARSLWSADYDPLRHESSLKSNIRRLRDLLEGTGMTIETEAEGYRLLLPPSTLVVTPPQATR
jgi:DNA-binding response OmpR family regulator